MAIRFPEYRQYEAARIESNNAIMGLLAGARLASHLLQLNAGSNRLLPEVYPKVAHVQRINLTSERAREILEDGDRYLGAMGVPFALAIHEDYMKTCLGLLVRAGVCTPSQASVNLVHQHSTFATCAGVTLSASDLAQIDTLRLMRNCIIHSGGRASGALVAQVAAWGADAEDEWMRLASRNPRSLQVGEVVTFTHEEMVLALAVTKRLDREVNDALGNALPRSMWAEMVVEDLLVDSPKALRNPNALRRSCGLARHHYRSLNLTEGELQIAIEGKK